MWRKTKRNPSNIQHTVMAEKKRQGNRRSSRQILFRKIGLPLSALAKRQWQPRVSTRASVAASGKATSGLRSRLSRPTDIQFLFSLLPDVPCEIPRLAEFSARYLNSVSSPCRTYPRFRSVKRCLLRVASYRDLPPVFMGLNLCHKGEQNSISTSDG